MATGLAENSSGGSFYESDIQELFASHGITVKYNYILKPEGDEEYGFSNTVLYHIIGQGIVSGPEFEDEFTSYGFILQTGKCRSIDLQAMTH